MPGPGGGRGRRPAARLHCRPGCPAGCRAKEHGPRMRRGVYLLPNLFTTGGLFAGFYAIVAAIHARPVEAAVAVLVAGLLDGLDGRIARLTNTQSEFGTQYDSLSDLVSFGLAPALLMYTWSLSTLRDWGNFAGKAGFAAAFLYAACAALRLARFNTQVGVADKRFFQGLASPAAAGLVVSFVWTCREFELSGADVAWPALGVMTAAAVLMVSNFRYYSFKTLKVNDRVPFLWALALLGVFVLLAIDLPRHMFILVAIYVASGPIYTVWNLRRSRRSRREQLRPPAEGGEEAP
ncbi:MAG: CDP-diacylglycerol--serine O-phosphatidyltransferase [Xanthomonadales bacterium]|nr:CDP-diacylglycerol--serine O-phosphatidyltransferase [Xanthomonadales bacterium]